MVPQFELRAVSATVSTKASLFSSNCKKRPMLYLNEVSGKKFNTYLDQ